MRGGRVARSAGVRYLFARYPLRILKPPALRPGDVIGVCAPSSPSKDRGMIDAGIRYLEGLGYRIAMSKNLYKRDGYLAGTDRERAADFNGLIARRDVRAIIALRGGYGAARILPLIDFNLVKRNPKIIVGYSDITALQLALFHRTGLISFAGPMVAAALARGLGERAEEWFWDMITRAAPPGRVPGSGMAFRRKGSKLKRGGRDAAGRAIAGRAVTTREVTGRLLGGNLSILASLAGTPYIPDFRGAVLFIEDVGEYPYRIDRTLHQLKLSGMLSRVRGLVTGTFADCKPAPDSASLRLGRILDDVAAGYSFPLLTGVHHGHVGGSFCLPVGARVAVGRGGRPRLDILESCVRSR